MAIYCYTTDIVWINLCKSVNNIIKRTLDQLNIIKKKKNFNEMSVRLVSMLHRLYNQNTT